MRLHGWGSQPAGLEALATSALGQLLYPVFWFAPFYTGSGYSTEAISFVSALVQTERFRPEDVWLSHSGDHILQVGAQLHVLTCAAARPQAWPQGAGPPGGQYACSTATTCKTYK